MELLESLNIYGPLISGRHGLVLKTLSDIEAEMDTLCFLSRLRNVSRLRNDRFKLEEPSTGAN